MGEKLTAIAENMPRIYQKGYGVGQSVGYDQGYQEGVTVGGIAGKESCLMNHYTTTFFGSGTNEVLLEIHFQPDIVMVYTTHSYTSYVPNCYRGFMVDLRACGRHMGNFFYTAGEGVTKSAWLISNLGESITSYRNGIFRFCMDVEALKDVVWMPNIRYHLIAVKFPEENPRDMILEQIYLLPDTVPEGCSGQLPYTESVIYTYFSREEWEFVTSQKPNWTFVLK